MASRDLVLLPSQTLTATANGTVDHSVIPQEDTWTASLVVDGPVTGTSPTLDVTVQVNDDPGLDATAWRTVATFSQVTAALASAQTQAIAAGVLGAGGRRVHAVVGGTTPSFAGVEVVLG